MSQKQRSQTRSGVQCLSAANLEQAGKPRVKGTGRLFHCSRSEFYAGLKRPPSRHGGTEGRLPAEIRATPHVVLH